MLTTLRYLQLLTLTIWVGGLTFFAFILAPTAFAVLPTIHLAGSVVGECLKRFDLVALASGAIFLAVTAELYRRATNRIRGRYEAEFLLAGAMLLATAYLHWNIIPAMDADQLTANGDINSLPATNPAHLHFDKLHKRSENIAGGVLLIGLVVLCFVSREHARPSPPSA